MRFQDLLLSATLLLFGPPFFSTAYSQQECRVHETDLRPIIPSSSPRFYNHRWNDDIKVETAQMDSYRTLVISQDGCIRLHTTFNLIIQQPAIASLDSWFWVQQMHDIFGAVYVDSPVYKTFGPEFERTFIEKIAQMGINRSFNFPLNTRNFVCEVTYNPPSDARLRVEMVEYIFKEKIQAPTPPAPAAAPSKPMTTSGL